jgi:predicted O-methyltransferase YrrM
MLRDLKTSVDFCKREDGPKALQVAFQFLWKQYLFVPILPYAMNRLRRAQSIKETRRLVHFTFTFSHGLMKPLQEQDELVELMNYVRREKPRTVLEIGTSLGGTLFLFCHVAAEDATILSVDLPMGRFGAGYSLARLPLNKSFPLEQQHLHLIQGDSHAQDTLEAVQSLLDGRRLDVLFLDGDRSYEGVKQDFSMYSPLVRDNGLIIFHDILESKYQDCKVKKLWDELAPKYENRSIVKDPGQRWAGIGMLRK